jgi:hypothetical protein
MKVAPDAFVRASKALKIIVERSMRLSANPPFEIVISRPI